MHPMKRAGTLACLTLFVGTAGASTLTRDRDPVVMRGVELPTFAGVAVDRVVAFRHDGGWTQIAVQIDERVVVDYADVYQTTLFSYTAPAWADANTYTGADPDPTFDADDELTLMAADAGAQAPAGLVLPGSVLLNSGLEVEISDALDGGTGWVYLFESNGGLPQGAGVDYGTYTFNLLAGSYIPNYGTLTGPNPENSSFSSSLYATHFSDRWIRDELAVTAGAASGADILDRHKNMFAPGNCARTENTFSNGEGAFFANIDGPVRAIRSYMGANSGPLTQRDHVFYQGRQDITTILRVHGISGVVDLYDYSPAATGMTYFNDLNPAGAAVNGSPDVVTPGAITWEMVTGVQGSVSVAHVIETDIMPFSYTSYYSDDLTPAVTQCTGDGAEYATSGPWINQPIPNTDPLLAPPLSFFLTQRIIYYDPPGVTVAHAALRNDQATTPLGVTTSPYTGAPAVPVLTGWGVLALLAALSIGGGLLLRGARWRGTASGQGI